MKTKCYLTFLKFLIFVKVIKNYPLYGNSSIGYYYIKGYFGLNNFEQDLIFDTGSDQIVIDCDPCESCGTHFNNHYKIEDSTTKQTPENFAGYQCKNSNCDFGISYSEGSSYSGKLYKELFNFDNLQNETKKEGDLNISLDKKVDNSENVNYKKNMENFYIIVGCATSESGLFVSQKADGIIGMSPRKGKDIPNIIKLLKYQALIEESIYSICIGIDGGVFSLLDWNSNFHSFSENKIYLDLSDYDWEDYLKIPVNKILIEDENVDYDFEMVNNDYSYAFLDTGTTITYFPSNLFSEIKIAFEKFCQKSSSNCNSESEMKNCYTKSFLNFASIPEILKSFPVIKFNIKDFVFEWKPENYFVISDHDFCIGFEQDTSLNITLGATFMRNYDFFVNVDKNILGIVKANCNPEVTHFSHKIVENNFYNQKLNKKILNFRNQKNFLLKNYQNFKPEYFVYILLIAFLAVISRYLTYKRRGIREEFDDFLPMELFE